VRQKKLFIAETSQLTNGLFSKIFEAFDNINFKWAKSVIVKPNLAAGTLKKSDTACVTDSNVLLCLVDYITGVNENCKVYIAESDSTGSGFAFLKFKYQGYNKLFKDYKNVSLLDLSRDELLEVKHLGLFFDKLFVSKTFITADLFISLSKLKTHNMTRVTGALKNQFGILPISDKEKYHPFLNRVIPDIVSARIPDLSIIDGILTMEGDGPVNGVPIRRDVVLASNDPVLIDAAMCKIFGMNPYSVKHIRQCHKYGLGEIELEKAEISGNINKHIRKPVEISLIHAVTVSIGLFIQRLGFHLESFGHEFHNLDNPIKLPFVYAKKIIKKLARSRNKKLARMAQKILNDYREKKATSNI